LPLAADWLSRLQEVRKLDKRTRIGVVNAEARRVVSNENLDNACELFGAALLEGVGGDLSAERWRRFFEMPVGSFIRQALARQVVAVAKWLGHDDPILENHREALAQWSAAAQAAVQDTQSLATTRAKNQIGREQLAEDLSRERDALHCALVELGESAQLPITWPEAFFMRTGLLSRP